MTHRLRKTSRRRLEWRRWTALFLALALLVTSCGSSDDSSSSTEAETTDDADTADAADEDAASDDTTDGDADDTASADDDAPTGTADGGVLRYASVSEPSTLDPHTGTSGGDHVSLYPIYDSLIVADPATLAPTPGLATSFEFVDELTLVLELREGVVFHDGTPFDAEAVVYNIERALTHEASVLKPDLASVDSAEAVDTYTVNLNLNTPDSALLGVLADRAGMMVSPAAGDTEDFGRNPVGTGPFLFEEWLPGDSWSYVRNPDYWQDGVPSLDGLDFSLVSDINTRLNGLRSGQLDFIDGLDPSQISTVEAEDGLTVSVDPTVLAHMIWWNTSRPPLDDARVREAINIAIDREALWAATMEGTGEPQWQPVPSAHWAFDPDQNPSFEYDPDRARELLAEAGYGDGTSIEVVSAAPDSFVTRAEIIQAQLAAVGIEMSVRPLETVQAVDEYFENKRVHGFNTSMTARADPAMTYGTIFSESSYHNSGGWTPEGFEDLLIEARAKPTTEERAEVYAELTAMAVEHGLWVPLVFPSSIVAYSDAVEGFVPSLIAKPNFNQVSLSE